MKGAGVRPPADGGPRPRGPATGSREVPSFIAGLRATEFPGHAQEYDVRALLDTADAGHDITALPLLDDRAELRRGVDLITGRLSPAPSPASTAT